MSWFSKKNRVVSQPVSDNHLAEVEVKAPSILKQRQASSLSTPTENEQRSTSSLSNPESWLTELFGAVAAESGVAVTPSNAMSCTAVRNAVLAISQPCGTLPLHTYRRLPNGGKERVSDHPVSRLCNGRANAWSPGPEYRETMAVDALTHGNHYSFIVRDGNANPVELIRFDPGTVKVKIDDRTSEPVYERSGNERYSFRDILHLRAPGHDGYTGDSPVIQCREAIGVAMTLEKHSARLFARGARPSGILSFPEKLQADAAKNIAAAWNNAHGGDKSGNTALIDSNGKFQPLTFSSVDNQFLELRRFSIEEIARVYRISPTLLQDLGRATYSNSEVLGQQFLSYTLLPWLERFTGEINLKLFGGDDSYFVEYLVDDLLRADFAARMEGYSKMIASRVLSPNEVRARENLPPYTGGDTYENPNTSTQGAAQKKEPAPNE